VCAVPSPASGAQSHHRFGSLNSTPSPVSYINTPSPLGFSPMTPGAPQTPGSGESMDAECDTDTRVFVAAW
jgi:hypothetical protein